MQLQLHPVSVAREVVDLPGMLAIGKVDEDGGIRRAHGRCEMIETRTDAPRMADR